MSENKESNNTGCIVLVALLVIGNLIYFFATESSESIAETGGALLVVAGLAIAYFVCKALFGNESSDSDHPKDSSPFSDSTSISDLSSISDSSPSSSKSDTDNASSNSSWGCIWRGLACLVITGGIVTTITTSDSMNYAVGAIGAVVGITVIGIVLYYSFKE